MKRNLVKQTRWLPYIRNNHLDRRLDEITRFKCCSQESTSCSQCQNILKQEVTRYTETTGYSLYWNKRLLVILKQTFILNIRGTYFSNRVIDIWNELPENVVMAPSLNSFKSRLVPSNTFPARGLDIGRQAWESNRSCNWISPRFYPSSLKSPRNGLLQIGLFMYVPS